MSIPNESLQKLLQEIELKSQLAQREINIVKTSVASKQRDTRLLELTAKELGALPAETQVYEGVGKMFVAKPSADVQKRLAAETEGLRNDVAGLNKKLNYLETTHRNSQQHIDRILNSGGR